MFPAFEFCTISISAARNTLKIKSLHNDYLVPLPCKKKWGPSLIEWTLFTSTTWLRKGATWISGQSYAMLNSYPVRTIFSRHFFLSLSLLTRDRSLSPIYKIILVIMIAMYWKLLNFKVKYEMDFCKCFCTKSDKLIQKITNVA